MIAEENMNYNIIHLEDSSEEIVALKNEKHLRVSIMYLETIRIEYDKMVRNRQAIPYNTLEKIADI